MSRSITVSTEIKHNICLGASIALQVQSQKEFCKKSVKRRGVSSISFKSQMYTTMKVHLLLQITNWVERQ